MTGWGSVVLAAGLGRRMRSKIPKVLHPIAGKEMLRYVLDAIGQTEPRKSLVIVGPNSSAIRDRVGNGVSLVTQAEARGTGDALVQSQPLLEQVVDSVLVVNGDQPLITSETLGKMMEHHLATEAVVTVLTSETEHPDGLGRVVRDGDSSISEIIEERDATSEQLAIREFCAGAYCLQASWLWPVLSRLEPHASGEYYLTDLVAIASGEGQRVESTRPNEPEEAIGVNDRLDLASASRIVYQRNRERWMREGVTLPDPGTVYIDTDVEIDIDTVVHPGTSIGGKSRIAQGCEIGPHSIVTDSVMGDGCRIRASVIEASTLEKNVDVGPYSHVRPGSHLESGVHLGNYVEVKKSRLGRGTRVGHFTYLGDAALGANVNIGAGTVTCNYDGVRKNPTTIEDGAFIGCDSMLVAPIVIGARAVTGAGAVVTHDVPPDTQVAGVPARVMKKLDGHSREEEHQTIT